jgi:hypothetical protein
MMVAVDFVSVYRGGSARASRAVFGALAEHTFRSARAPTGAAEAAALPDAKHVLAPGWFEDAPLALTEAATQTDAAAAGNASGGGIGFGAFS